MNVRYRNLGVRIRCGHFCAGTICLSPLAPLRMGRCHKVLHLLAVMHHLPHSFCTTSDGKVLPGIIPFSWHTTFASLRLKKNMHLSSSETSGSSYATLPCVILSGLLALTSVWSCATYLEYFLASACSDLCLILCWLFRIFADLCSDLCLLSLCMILCCIFLIFACLCLLLILCYLFYLGYLPVSVCYGLSLILCCLFRIFAGLCLLWPLFDLVLPIHDICLPLSTIDLVLPILFRIFAGLCLLCALCGAVMRPLPRRPQPTGSNLIFKLR